MQVRPCARVCVPWVLAFMVLFVYNSFEFNFIFIYHSFRFFLGSNGIKIHHFLSYLAHSRILCFFYRRQYYTVDIIFCIQKMKTILWLEFKNRVCEQFSKVFFLNMWIIWKYTSTYNKCYHQMYTSKFVRACSSSSNTINGDSEKRKAYSDKIQKFCLDYYEFISINY